MFNSISCFITKETKTKVSFLREKIAENAPDQTWWNNKKKDEFSYQNDSLKLQNLFDLFDPARFLT